MGLRLSLRDFAKPLTTWAEMRSSIRPSLALDLPPATVAWKTSLAIRIQRLREIAALSVDVLVLLIEGRSALKHSAFENSLGNVDQLKVLLL